MLYRLQFALALETLHNSRLLGEHPPVLLSPNLGKLLPSLEVVLVAFVPVRFSRMRPMTYVQSQSKIDRERNIKLTAHSPSEKAIKVVMRFCAMS